MTPRTSLRWRLRDATAQAHARLDARLGGALDDADRYAGFLRGMDGFLAAAAAIDPARDHAATRRALAADLADLGVAPAGVATPAPVDPAQALGWRYVAAGSSLGARVLLPRARKLGFDADHGARYLAAQAAGSDWGPLLDALDSVPDADADAVIAGACSAFAWAEHCMPDAFEIHSA